MIVLQVASQSQVLAFKSQVKSYVRAPKQVIIRSSPNVMPFEKLYLLNIS